MGIKSVENIYFTVDIPRGYPPDIRQAIAQEIVDFIVERTHKGKDKYGDKFTPGYSAVYANSLEGRIGGKVKGATPNLDLSGEMLNSLRLLEGKSKATKLAIGYLRSDEVAGRVEGNVIGSYGGAPDKKKARDFLGINPDDLKNILNKYPLEDLELAMERAEALNEGT
jgi:hypothetical protein